MTKLQWQQMWCTSGEAKHDQKIRELPSHRITGTINNRVLHYA